MAIVNALAGRDGGITVDQAGYCGEKHKTLNYGSNNARPVLRQCFSA